MSLTMPATVTCPECGASLQVERATSVNAGRHPDLRESILAGTFQRTECGCGTQVRVAPELSYLDVDRKQWISVQPAEGLGTWRRHEAEAQALFDQALGAGAPGVAQALGEGISPRLVFGWPALREKLLVEERGVDEVTLELLKLTLLRDQGILPVAGQELRLTQVQDDGALVVGLVEVETEAVLSAWGVPRARYDAVLADLSRYGELPGQLRAGAFCDVQRLYYDG